MFLFSFQSIRAKVKCTNVCVYVARSLPPYGNYDFFVIFLVAHSLRRECRIFNGINEVLPKRICSTNTVYKSYTNFIII